MEGWNVVLGFCCQTNEVAAVCTFCNVTAQKCWKYFDMPLSSCHVNFCFSLSGVVVKSYLLSLSLSYFFLFPFFCCSSSNIPSSFHIPRWIKTAGMGLLVAAGLGSLLFILIRLGRRRIVPAHAFSW